jgi:Dolichyl-phosphate-mannose-protein mannosyltransferase
MYAAATELTVPHVTDDSFANHGGWLAAATLVAMVSGVSGALLLMWGHLVRGGELLLVGVVALRWPRSIWHVPPGADLTPRTRWLALAAVCAVAVFFRTYHLEPPGIWGDDAINGLLAFDVLDGKITSPFQLVVHAKSAFHALTNYTIAGAFWLLGPGPGTLRVPGLVAGAIAVPLLYGTVAPLFGAPVGLVAALFFATSPLQLNHDKVLIQVVLGEFFLLLGMCALVRGVARSRRWLMALAGAPLALCLYTYHSAKIAPLVAVIFALATIRKTAAPRRTLLVGFAGLCAVFLLCSIPAIVGYAQQPTALTGRAGAVALWPAIRSSGSLRPLWEAVWRTLMIFHYRQGPIYHWVGIGWDPALTVVPAFLVVHGMVQSLRHWKEPRHSLMLSWVVVGLIPGFLSTEAPRVYRVLLASPPLYVWAALPLVQLYKCAAQTAPRWRWLKGVVALTLLSVPLVDFNYYFYRVYTNREFRWFQAARLVEMARTLKALGPGWTGYLITDGFAAEYETLAFLSRAWGVTFRDVRSLTDVLPIHDEPEQGALLIVDGSKEALTALIASFYPTVAADVRTDPPIRTWWFDRWLPLVAAQEPVPPTVTFFAVSRRTADSVRGLRATFIGADGRPLTTRIDQRLRIEGLAQLPSGPVAPTQVTWTGAVYAPIDGVYQFELESTADAQLWIDEHLVVARNENAGAASLPQGLHRITAAARIGGTPVFQLRWQPPGAMLSEIPPELLFRNDDIHGLLAEYELGDHRLRRVEPYPYYAFFRETFDKPFAAHWRGQLHIPPPGGYRLNVSSNGEATLAADGHPLQADTRLRAGTHELTMDIADLSGAARLEVFWQRGDTDRRLIPPSAFTPPVE